MKKKVRKKADNYLNTLFGQGLFVPGSFGVPNIDPKLLKAFSKSIHNHEGYKDILQKTLKNYYGGNIDIHKLIGKLPIPKGGWTPPGYKYMGPYNPLEKQLEYDPNTGEVLNWKVKPKNRVDEITAHHDICYDMGKNKGECDKKNG